MYFRLTLFAAFITSTLSNASESNQKVLQKIWKLGSEHACTEKMKMAFSQENLELISSQTLGSNSRDLQKVLNPFLRSLGYSHTGFYVKPDESFYFFKTINEGSSGDLFWNPGVQLGKDGKGYFVREVLDGFSAMENQVLRGDRILAINGSPFDGDWGSSPKAKVLVGRKGRLISLDLNIHKLNWSEAFYQATEKSARMFKKNGKTIGYVHLWTGTHPNSASFLREWIATHREHLDGVILDLRGGFGGAWWEHLDPFFKNRDRYFKATVFNAQGLVESVLSSEPQENSQSFSGPMAVLINEGVRSGKEALAYQFKKSKRAVLVGTKTKGYFTVGRFFFSDQMTDYVLYLCHKRLWLDENEIEGVGVSPDIKIEFKIDPSGGDSQLEAAVEVLGRF